MPRDFQLKTAKNVSIQTILTDHKNKVIYQRLMYI